MEVGDLAGIGLPRSAKEQVEAALCFMANTPNAAGFADAVATAQLQPWFPAYVECLLDPSWQIPGFSPWWSARIKVFLRVRLFFCFFPVNFLFADAPPQELEPDCFWTFYQPVAAATPFVDGGVADAACIERTVCEDRDLLITTQSMDYWLRCVRDCATHAVYWPLALLPFVVGPHIINGAFFVRSIRAGLCG